MPDSCSATIFPVMTLRFVALLLLPVALSAQDTARLRWVPNPRVQNGGWVSDPARHLKPATVSMVNTAITSLERETSAEVAVVVLDSLDGLEPGAAAFLLHRRWGVGKAARDNGVVLLWSPAQRKIFISVGYGLEGVLPDARAGRIQDEEIIPHFRLNHFDDGIISGVAAITNVVRTEKYTGPTRARIGGTPPRPAQPPSLRNPTPSAIVAGLTLIVAPLLAILGFILYSRRPPKCPRGHGPMRKLDETADDAMLDRGQSLEERLGSVNYDVWTCGACDAVTIVPHRKWFSRYQECPKCERRTVEVRSTQLRAPTYHSTGLQRVTRTCGNCGWTDTRDETIPMLVHTSSSSSGGGSSFSGGGGRGGGSSFGGGSSGGGGAGRSY